MGVKGKSPPPTRLVSRLTDPGMTPLLRAGLGGLAASLHALERRPPTTPLPGTWRVEPQSVTLDWQEPGKAAPFLQALFEASFRLTRDHGLIDLPGTYGDLRPAPALLGALQDAMRQTFLQHGKTAKKNGAPRTVTFEMDGVPFSAALQGYSWFAHQDVWKDVAEALDRPGRDGSAIELAGWANPGAVQRHVAFGDTRMTYSPGEALCATFSLAGCISLRAPRGGVLVVPDPADLCRFSRLRPRLTPGSPREVHVGGTGDAVLSIETALRSMEVSEAPGMGTHILGLRFRPTAWASQQKSRVDTVEAWSFPDETISLYRRIAGALPARVLVPKTSAQEEPSGYFAIPSALRAFVCDNLARNLPWHAGFATARVGRSRRLSRDPSCDGSAGLLVLRTLPRSAPQD